MRFGLKAVLFLAVAAGTVSAQTRNDLPVSIGSALDKQYPRWSFPASDPHFMDRLEGTGMFPTLVFGDYNEDGNRDYAMRIEYYQKSARKGAILAFVSQGADFVPHVLRAYEENTAPEESLSYYSYLYPQAKGTTDYDYELEKEFVFEKDAFMDVADGKGSVSYIFEDGKFRQVITGD